MAGSEVNVFSFAHHDEAFDKAFEIRSEGAIIFSPACQSFDEFKDYRERAEAWNSAVKNYFS
jgi:UDP-N-acetylmuramoylalanine-D-glutamate ligase